MIMDIVNNYPLSLDSVTLCKRYSFPINKVISILIHTFTFIEVMSKGLSICDRISKPSSGLFWKQIGTLVLSYPLQDQHPRHTYSFTHTCFKARSAALTIALDERETPSSTACLIIRNVALNDSGVFWKYKIAKVQYNETLKFTWKKIAPFE